MSVWIGFYHLISSSETRNSKVDVFLASERIRKYKKTGLALRGAHYREGLSQKELVKQTGVSQENISKMENGQRQIDEKVAKKLAKSLHINHEILINP